MVLNGISNQKKAQHHQCIIASFDYSGKCETNEMESHPIKNVILIFHYIPFPYAYPECNWSALPSLLAVHDLITASHVWQIKAIKDAERNRKCLPAALPPSTPVHVTVGDLPYLGSRGKWCVLGYGVLAELWEGNAITWLCGSVRLALCVCLSERAVIDILSYLPI